MTDETSDTNDLAEKVEQLENELSETRAQLEEQQSTIQRMMPSRRDVVKGGAVAGGAGLMGLLFGSSASASTGSAGQIGTQSDRPDVYADVVNTDNLAITPLDTVTRSIPSGGSDTYQFADNIKGADIDGDNVLVTVTPINPDNNFTADWTLGYNSAFDRLEVTVTDSSDAGGADVRIAAWYIGTA